MTDEQPPKRNKPTNYRVLCVSMYTQDIERMDEFVAELKKRGRTKTNRSELIRIAVSMLDIDKIAPPVDVTK